MASVEERKKWDSLALARVLPLRNAKKATPF